MKNFNSIQLFNFNYIAQNYVNHAFFKKPQAFSQLRLAIKH